MPKLLILDTETTGLLASDEPIEVALTLVEVDASGNLISDLQTYSGRRQPAVPISLQAQKVHGIRPSDVAGLDFDHAVVKDLIASADVIVAHNADFDARMLKALFPEIMGKDWRCTLRQWPWPSALGTKLSDAAAMLGVVEVAAHSALGDVNVLKACIFGGKTGRSYCNQLLEAESYTIGTPKSYASVRAAQALAPETQGACSELLGIIAGVMADRKLVDEEIALLRSWIERHPELVTVWPVTEVAEMLESILEDSVVTSAERLRLESLLDAVSNTSFKTVANAVRSESLQLDDVDDIAFSGQRFCLTGNFLYGDKDLCTSEIERRGGSVSSGVSKKVDFLVVGGLGSAEWKHGNFGTKVVKAIECRAAGAGVRIIHEETWARCLR